MSKETGERNAAHVQSVERALILLDFLATIDKDVALNEIAKALSWPKTTAHGLISTLRSRQYVDQSPTTGCYRLGVKLFELGNIVARSWDIRTVARPAMQELSCRLNELVQLATESGGEVLYIEKMDATNIIRIISEVGAKLPMYCTGLGKVLLAYKEPAEIKWIITKHGLHKMTARTITNRDILERQLVKIRSQGYAIDDREISEDLRCVAAPIFDRDGKVDYAISVACLAGNLYGERLDLVRDELLKTAAYISGMMGYREQVDE